jgi:hypothetical protein
MAITNQHWPPGGNTPGGSRLADALKGFEAARDRLVKEAMTMNATLEGNGTDPSHYGKVNTYYGFGGLDESQSARNELLAGLGKVDPLGDSGNTADTQAKAALDQLFTRLR